jgi:hypothetical protein
MAVVVTSPLSMSRAERTRVIFERYRASFDDVSDMVQDQDGLDGRLRVHASIGSRVRYRCHVCGAIFQYKRACHQCSHERCDACPRSLLSMTQKLLRTQRRLLVELVNALDFFP